MDTSLLFHFGSYPQNRFTPHVLKLPVISELKIHIKTGK